jgi:hypothetical protein
MSSLADRISLLRQRAADIATQLTSLGDRRRSYSLAAAEGDDHAKREIGGIDLEQADLLSLQQTIEDSIEVGEALEKQQALEAVQKAERDKDIQAYKVASAVQALNGELDEELKKLRELCERRQSLLAELAQLDAMNASLLARLSSKAPLTRAACAVGLQRYLSLETTAPGSWAPLSESNSTLLGVGRPPDKPEKTARVKLQ